MSDFYEADLAYCHHVGFANPALPAAVLGILGDARVRDGTVVDLGCAGGHLLAALTGGGYRAVGVDRSAAALEIAAGVAPGAERYVGRAEDFDLPACRAVAALGEVLCYLSDGGQDALSDTTFLTLVFDALEPGGFLIFDVVVRDEANPFRYRHRRQGVDWVIDHAVDEDMHRRILCRDIVLDRYVDGVWRRSREFHRLRLHAAAEIETSLREAGFDVHASDRLGDVVMLPRRTAFICRKPAC